MEQQFIVGSVKFVFLYGLEGIAFLAIAVYGAIRLSSGVWAALSLVGGIVGGLPLLFYAFAWGQLQWAHDASAFELLDRHALLIHSDWSQPIAIGVLAAALVFATRTRPSAREV